MQSATTDKETANLALGYSLPPMSCLSGSQPIYNEQGIIVFRTYNQIHKLQRTIEANMITQGMESLSIPLYGQANAVIHVDHNGNPLSYKDALNQDPGNWLPAIKDKLQSHHENGTWIVQEISLLPKELKPIPGK
jgi:hypothetical protein